MKKDNDHIIVMRWAGERGQYDYAMTSETAKKVANAKGIRTVIISHYMSRDDAANMLNVPLEKLP